MAGAAYLSCAALGRVAAEAALVHVSDLQPQQPGPQGDILVGKPVQQDWLSTPPLGDKKTKKNTLLVQLCRRAPSLAASNAC